MPLTIVNVAYPIIPISGDTVGGTEQIVALIDEGLVRHGHRSIVIAAEGSRVAGTLVTTPAAVGSEPIDWDKAYAIHRQTLARVLAEFPVDIIHLHGVDFHTYLSGTKLPVLVTLHLPWFNYPADIASPARPHTFVNCVSRYARGNYDPNAHMPIILGGIALDRFTPGPLREDFVFTLGRIVPEKGYHLALDAAHEAGFPLVLAGKVPPFPEAQAYFEQEIQPRLDSSGVSSERQIWRNGSTLWRRRAVWSCPAWCRSPGHWLPWNRRRAARRSLRIASVRFRSSCSPAGLASSLRRAMLLRWRRPCVMRTPLIPRNVVALHANCFLQSV